MAKFSDMEILDLSTAEMDDALVLAPDGAGGVEFRAEAGGGGSAPASARYIRSAGDYTTNSTTWVDVDGTNMALTITTGANRVMIIFAGSCFNSGAGNKVGMTVAVDGVDQGGGQPFGIVYHRMSAASEFHNMSFVYVTDVLTAGSHTFKLRWGVNAGTATMGGGSGGGPRSEFAVVEVA